MTLLLLKEDSKKMSVRGFFLFGFFFLSLVYFFKASLDLDSLLASYSGKKDKKEGTSKESIEESEQDKIRAVDKEINQQKETARKKYIPQVSTPGSDIKSGENNTPSLMEIKKKQMELTAKFHSVLIKRGVTLLMVFVVAIIVVIFVIPQFKALFGEKMEIPWAMNFLLNLSQFFVRFGIIIGIILGLGIATFYYFTVNNAKIRWWWHDFILHMPVLGKTLRTYYTAQFAYLLSTLLTKNVDIIRSMEIIIKQNNNVCMKKTYGNLVTSMQGGDDLFTAIIKENDVGRDYLIPSIVQAAKVGGATASLGDTLMDVRNDLDELFVIRLERAIKGFSAVFYAIIVMFAVFLAYAIGSAIIAFYENAQSLI